MKIFIITLLCILPLPKLFAQEATHDLKQIILSKYPQTVPVGKIWKLESGQPIKVQLHPGTLELGTLCSAWLLSKPSIVAFIKSGSIYEPNVYSIILSKFEKVPYTNNITYLIYPISFITKKVSPEELVNKSTEEIGEKELIFFENESVYISDCLQSLEVTEYIMNKKDKEFLAKKKELYNQRQENIANNFNIPSYTNGYVEPDTQPKYFDIGLKEIFFESNPSMILKHDDEHFFMDTTFWFIKINDKTVELYNETIEKDFSELSSFNAVRKFRLLDIQFNKVARTQEFRLSEFNNLHTHNLYVIKNSDSYIVDIISQINKEELRFNSIKVSKKFKNY